MHLRGRGVGGHEALSIPKGKAKGSHCFDDNVSDPPEVTSGARRDGPVPSRSARLARTTARPKQQLPSPFFSSPGKPLVLRTR